MSAAPRPFAPGHRTLAPLGADAIERWVRRCRDHLAACQGVDADRVAVRALRVSEKSQVFACSADGSTCVWKHHRDPVGFAHELAALCLFAPTQRVPRLLAHDAEEQVLLLEHLSRAFRVERTEDLVAVARALGDVHATADSTDLEQHLPGASIGGWLEQATAFPAWISDPEAMQRALRLVASRSGAAHVPVGIGDLKSEHLFQRDGCVFVDLECARPGLPQQLDLVALLNVAPGGRLTPAQWESVLCVYQATRWSRRAAMPLRELRESVRLVGVAIGIRAECLP